MFEDLVKKVSPVPLDDVVHFSRASEWITKMELKASPRDDKPVDAYVVMPFEGMGIFYYTIPRELEFGAHIDGRRPVLTDRLRFFKLNYCMDGRVEVFMRGKGKYAYLDKSMVGFDENDPQVLLTFRKEYYRGFGLYFNFELMSDSDRTTLSYYGITKEACMQLIERDKECFLGNASQEFRQIVEDLTKGIDDRSLDLPRARMQSTRLLYLLLHEDVEPLRKSEYTTSGQRKIAEDARKRILQDPSIHLTAEELAKDLRCTAPALKMYFRKVYGVPIYTFLQNVRLQKAEEDLRKTRKSIADLAEEAGYSNPSKFCALFKKTYGVTPTEYRRLHT